MFGRDRSKLPLKSNADIIAMRRAGLVTGSALRASALATKDGMTTKDIDQVAFDVMKDAGATPSFLGYGGFPATLCISINDEVVHGIPGERGVRDGDVISLDCGAIVDGWHGDSALTFIVGVPDEHPASAQSVAARHAGSASQVGDVAGAAAKVASGDQTALILTTEASMWDGIRAIEAGQRLNRVGEAVENNIRVVNADAGEFEIVDGYTGHGVGKELHQDPTVYNEAVRERLPKVAPGLVIAVEPMVTLGTYETFELEDGWTVKTEDGSDAAHFEHTVAVTPGGLWVLTAEDGGASVLGERYSPLA